MAKFLIRMNPENVDKAMTIELYPNVKPLPLSAVEPGSLVKYNGSLAFAIAEPEPPAKSISLAVLSDNRFTISQLERRETVFDFGHDYIIDISESPLDGERRHADQHSGTRLYLSEGRLLIVMLLPHVVSGWEAVDLRTGISTHYNGSPMPTVESWRLGFRGLTNEPVWMIKVPVTPTAS